MSLQGLPPLPKSLSGFLPTDSSPITSTAMRSTPVRLSTDVQSLQTTPSHFKTKNVAEQNFRASSGIGTSGRKSNSVDTKLAILRQEMYILRQLDLSLLAQLWSLNEQIQDYRQVMQEQDDRILLVPSPSPTQSSGDDADGDDFFTSTTSLNFRQVAPPPVARRPSTSSNASR